MDRNPQFLVRGSAAHIFSSRVDLHMAHNSWSNDFQGSYLFYDSSQDSIASMGRFRSIVITHDSWEIPGSLQFL